MLASPAIELAGCASRERNVPAYIDRLHLMTGVTDVGFSRAEKLDQKAAGGAGAADGCFNNDTKAASFELVTYFKQQSAPVAAPPRRPQPPRRRGTPAPAAGTTPPTTAPANQTAAVPTGGSR